MDTEMKIKTGGAVPMTCTVGGKPTPRTDVPQAPKPDQPPQVDASAARSTDRVVERMRMRQAARYRGGF